MKVLPSVVQYLQHLARGLIVWKWNCKKLTWWLWVIIMIGYGLL